MNDACFQTETCALCGAFVDCLPLIVDGVRSYKWDTVSSAGVFRITAQFSWHCIKCIETKIQTMRDLYGDPKYVEWMARVNGERQKNGLSPLPLS